MDGIGFRLFGNLAIAPAMICCEATLAGRAVLSPPQRVGLSWGQTPKVDTCTWGDLRTWIYMKEAQKSTKKRKTANKSKK